MIYAFRDWASCKYVGNLKRTVPVFWDPRRGMYVKAVPYPPGTVDAEGKVVPLATVDDERHGRISSLTAYHNAEHREQRRTDVIFRILFLYAALFFLTVVVIDTDSPLSLTPAGKAVAIVIGTALGVYCSWWCARGYLIKDSYVFPASDREVTLALIGSRDKYRFGSSPLYWCVPGFIWGFCLFLALGFSNDGPGLTKATAVVGIAVFATMMLYAAYFYYASVHNPDGSQA